MEFGKFYIKNKKLIDQLTDDDLRVAIKKCKEHIKIRLKQKTLYGAHTEKNLGESPLEYYLNTAVDKILSGDWEWKEGRTLSEQLIRVIDSQISKEVEKVKAAKNEKFKIIYDDIEKNFYSLCETIIDKDENEKDYQDRINLIEKAIIGDQELIDFFDAIKAGYKSSEIAELLGKTVKQLGKVKERLLRRVNAQKEINQKK